jgi:hypothetical protein
MIGSQRARVLVDGVEVGEWAPLAPSGGWRDQSIDLPAAATSGKSRITVRNDFVSSELDFNEFTYWVDSLGPGGPTRTDTVDVGPRSTADEAMHAYRIERETWRGTRTFRYPPGPAEEAAAAASDEILREARLRIAFDGLRTVDAPLGEFFGSGLGEVEVRSLMAALDPDGWYTAWWPMPYRARAKVELVNGSRQTIDLVEVRVTAERQPLWARALSRRGDVGYFHATATRGEAVFGRDWLFLDASGTGKFVGVSHTMEGRAPLDSRRYLEGDERVYVDGSRTPQIHGTGTEDFYEGGWYFNRGTFSLPLNGAPGHEVRSSGCELECDAAFRLMIADAVAFGSSLRFGIEHGPLSDEPAVYGSTAFWYGRRREALRQTDTLDVGDPASEAALDYRSPGAGMRTELEARFEGDDGTMIRDDGRSSTAPVRFRMRIDRRNRGVVLRRRSDQFEAEQAALVFVDGREAGLWRQPLHNTDHRWLEDAYELPPELTRGRRDLEIELHPVMGGPAWRAARYVALSRVAP